MKKDSVPIDEIVEKTSPPVKEVWKPNIKKLPDAVIDGKFVLQPGQDLVIQYPEPWRETIVWRVQHVYDSSCPTETVECETIEKNEVVKKKFTCVEGTTVRLGHVRLFDTQKNQFGSTNYLEAQERGLILKVWVKKTPK